jgi:hypothetical protein
MPPIEMVRFVGNNHALASLGEAPLQWLDLAKGTLREVGDRNTLRSIAGSPDGKVACAIDISRHAFLIRPDLPPEELDGTVTDAGFATADDLLLADEDGTVRHFDLRTNRQTTLVARKAKLLDIAWSRTTPAWIAVAFDDGTLWRKNLATGADATSSTPVRPTTRLLLLGDGTVLFGESRALRAWRPDGTLAAHAELARPISALGIAGTGPAIALTGEGSTYLVALDAPNRVTEVEAVGGTSAAMSADTGVYVTASRGGLDVIDPIVRHRWTLARAATRAYRDAQISADGRRVLAITSRGLLVWSWPRPQGPEATAAWLDSMTDAVIDATGRLAWQ